MVLTGIIISAAVMAGISAYMLFKIRDGEGEGDYKLTSSLQALFFFMILANFVLMGSAAYESRNDCEYLLTTITTVNSSLTTNGYDYVCEERVTGAASWIYRLPVWLAYMSGGYLIIYLLMLIANLVKYFRRGGERG